MNQMKQISSVTLLLYTSIKNSFISFLDVVVVCMTTFHYINCTSYAYMEIEICIWDKFRFRFRAMPQQQRRLRPRRRLRLGNQMHFSMCHSSVSSC